jgi:YVTN family beta-propeller protein
LSTPEHDLDKDDVAFASTLLLSNVTFADARPVDYHLANRYVLGGEGGWDYLTYDSAGKRLFISRSTHVTVVDPASGRIVGDIPNTPGVHGIALAPDLRKGFTSNGADGTVTVFDLRSLKTITTIQTSAKNPDGIVYDPASKRVLTFNGDSNDATVIDAQSNKVVATIPLGGRPEFAVADGKGMVYDNIESTGEIVAIDTSKAAIVSRFNLGACQNPSGISMDRVHRRLFTACRGEMGVVDADNGKVLATLPTGAGTDATRFDPNAQLAFASNGRDGTLTVVHEDTPDTFSVVQNAKSEVGARTMELDPQTGNVFLVTAQLHINPNATMYRERFQVVPGTFTLLVLSP